MRVLVVEDEEQLAATIARGLRREGFAVDVALDGGQALEKSSINSYDVVVLDRDLPAVHGDEVCRSLIATKPETRIIMLTAAGDIGDRVEGLSLGADDYLVKPFSPQELVLRVRNILRRTRTKASDRRNVLHVGAVEIDKDAHTVTQDGRLIELTATEYKLLMTLADRRGRVQSRAQLLEIVWESAPDIQTRTVDMHVQRLRAKLGAAGEMIETVRGFGYRLRRAAASER
jgi:two-component system phosphate regulon response regulator PhoB